MTNLDKAEQYLKENSNFFLHEELTIRMFAKWLDQEANASESMEKEKRHWCSTACEVCQTKTSSEELVEELVSVAGNTHILPQKPKIRHIYRTYILSGSDLRSQIDLITDKINELINTYNNES